MNRPKQAVTWLLTGFLALGGGAVAKAGIKDLIKVDRIMVKKSDRKMYLFRKGRIVRTYGISLGRNPRGHKHWEGDARTPEGSYVVDWRNPDSRFYKSIHISYPNEADRRYARQLGVSPGGAIMIHGLPNDIGRLVYLKRSKDWTEGCIAVDNEAMDELWVMVEDETPIDILP